MLGKSVFVYDLTSLYSEERPQIEGEISSALLYLDDIGLSPSGDTNTQTDNTVEGQPLFSEDAINFDKLNTVDLSLIIDIDEVTGADYSIDTIDAELNWKMEPSVSIMLMQDLKVGISPERWKLIVEMTRIKLQLSAKDLPVNFVLRQLRGSSEARGTINTIIDITSHGNSPQLLADNLKGDFGFVMENGIYTEQNMGFLPFDLFNQLLSGVISVNENKSINCAITRFSIDEGVAQSQYLYWSTRQYEITGEGNVDLATETLDLQLVPKAKTLLVSLAAKPVEVSGSISEPVIRIIPSTGLGSKIPGLGFVSQILIPRQSMDYLYDMVIENENDKSPCID